MSDAMLAASPILRHAGNVYIVELGLPPGCLAERPTPREETAAIVAFRFRPAMSNSGTLPPVRYREGGDPAWIPLRGNERPSAPE